MSNKFVDQENVKRKPKENDDDYAKMLNGSKSKKMMIRKMLKGSQKRMMMIRKNVERKLGSFLLPPPLPPKSAFGDLTYLPIAKRE